jgi:glycosyltransferase involved in cell wall biosynthesis
VTRSTPASPGADIVCLSTHYWDQPWFRKQQFMSRLIDRGCRVLYVQPSYSIVRRADWPSVSRNRWFTPLVEKRSDRLHLFSPPRLLPKYTHPWVSALNHRWFGILIARQASRLGMNTPCLWVYTPAYVSALKQIAHSRLVVDLVDDLEAYEHVPRHRLAARRRISTLVAQADLTIVTSSVLADKFAGQSKRCALVPNGFDGALFNGTRHPIPDDIAGIRRPVVGFVGVLFGFLDYELLYQAVSRMTDVSFVFVGPVSGVRGARGVERLRPLPNAHFVGAKDRNAVPAYVQAFDVCICPFKVDDVSCAVSPLKLYEYLASGKPVVSTPMTGVERELLEAHATRFVRFASGEEFVTALRDTLTDVPHGGLASDCIAAAQSFSWERRFHNLVPHLKGILGS